MSVQIHIRLLIVRNKRLVSTDIYSKESPDLSRQLSLTVLVTSSRNDAVILRQIGRLPQLGTSRSPHQASAAT